MSRFATLIEKAGYAVDRLGFRKEILWGLFSNFLPPLYDLKDSRIVEYAWVLRNMDLDSGTILDVGCGYSKFPIMLASLGYKVCALDLREYPKQSHVNFIFVKGDIRDANVPLPHADFDRIAMVSTLEHIGTGSEEERRIDDGDLKSLTHIRGLLKRNGKILITVPFGPKYIIKRGTRIYDYEKLIMLTKDFVVERMDYFRNSQGSYMPTTKPEDASLACFRLRANCTNEEAAR